MMKVQKYGKNENYLVIIIGDCKKESDNDLNALELEMQQALRSTRSKHFM